MAYLQGSQANRTQQRAPGPNPNNRPILTRRGRALAWLAGGALVAGAFTPLAVTAYDHLTHKEVAGCTLTAPELLRHSTDEFTMWGLSGEIAGYGDNQIGADDNFAVVNPNLNPADVIPGETKFNVPQEYCAETSRLYPGDVQPLRTPTHLGALATG